MGHADQFVTPSAAPPPHPPTLLSLFPMQAEELLILRQFPPQSLQGLVAQRNVLQAYAATYPRVVATGLCGAYVFMQTFAVPGTLMLSLLAGALYGAQRAWLLVAAVSTVGSCSCYCLSWLLGRQLVRAAWPAKLDRYAAEVQKRRSDMLNYIIFLRVTPLLPNTFINLASPIVGVPLLPFALGECGGGYGGGGTAVGGGWHAFIGGAVLLCASLSRARARVQAIGACATRWAVACAGGSAGLLCGVTLLA